MVECDQLLSCPVPSFHDVTSVNVLWFCVNRKDGLGLCHNYNVLITFYYRDNNNGYLNYYRDSDICDILVLNWH